jgi:activator of HSP90 ATPase
MAKTIEQTVVFKNTTPKALYNLYMDAKQHSLVTGGAVKVSAKAGSAFSAHNGYCFGKTLHTVKDELIVQTWKGLDWDKPEPDSVFSLRFEKKGKDAVVHMVHAFVPDKVSKGIVKGWNDFYWKPWKQHLAGKTITRAKM